MTNTTQFVGKLCKTKVIVAIPNSTVPANKLVTILSIKEYNDGGGYITYRVDFIFEDIVTCTHFLDPRNIKKWLEVVC